MGLTELPMLNDSKGMAVSVIKGRGSKARCLEVVVREGCSLARFG